MNINEALERFELIDGVGSLNDNQACAMTLLSWLSDETWTDHPECCHRLIADTVIRANDHDATTPEMRKELVRLGQDGALDTWWVPTEVVVMGLTQTGEDTPTDYERAVQILKRVAEWKVYKVKADLTGANLTRANLYGASLYGANLTRASLYGADLTGADLSEADLTGANLTRANLTRANLTRASLYGADLTGADLSEANLTRADLTGADLSEADLTGADLYGANLTRANLTRASLYGASLTRASLYGADLTRAFGTPYSGMPKGWKLDDDGLWIKEEA